MKKIVGLSALLATTLLGSHVALAADSATATTTKVCVAQIAKVLHESPQIKQDVEQLKKKFDKDQKAIEKAQADLDKSTKELSKNEMVMSAADKEKANKAIEAKRQAIMKQMSDFQTRLNAEQKTMMDVVFKKLNTIVQSQAKASMCDIVLDSQFVLWANDKFDITSSVAAAFDAEKAKK